MGDYRGRKTIMTFADLNIISPILKALEKEGYKEPTEIQSQAIPLLLAGKDLLASSQTGTGKTAAYAIPLLQTLSANTGNMTSSRTVRGLILSPTRELAAQIAECLSSYGRDLKLKTGIIFGGVPKGGQIRQLQSGVDIVVATPGRLLDLVNQNYINLSHVEILILDEADQMLDMGFLPDVKKIIRMAHNRKQTMMFSATMPPKIEQLVDEVFNDPVRIAITPVNEPIDNIDQSVYSIEKPDKPKLLLNFLADLSYYTVLVFTRTKHGANKLGKILSANGIKNETIHGNKSQNARTAALESFKNGKTRVLVATDIVARGIDVKGLSLVVNYDLPECNELYLHRMGRTGRAGFDGKVVTFCSNEEKPLLRDVQRFIGMTIPSKPLPDLSAIVLKKPFGGDDDREPRRRYVRHDSGSSWSSKPHHSYSSSGEEKSYKPTYSKDRHYGDVAPTRSSSSQDHQSETHQNSYDHQPSDSHRSYDHQPSDSHRSYDHHSVEGKRPSNNESLDRSSQMSFGHSDNHSHFGAFQGNKSSNSPTAQKSYHQSGSRSNKSSYGHNNGRG